MFHFFWQNILTYHLNNYCPVICSIPTRYVPKIHGIYLKEVRKVCKETDRANSINYRNIIIIIIIIIISFIIFIIIIIIIVKNRRLFWWMVIPYRFILFYILFLWHTSFLIVCFLVCFIVLLSKIHCANRSNTILTDINSTSAGNNLIHR